ncbi:MAG: EamA family transporter [Alphaproteobacteria bacterium]|nr:EamA family transporter [Alphaproteobacteria bacterium]
MPHTRHHKPAVGISYTLAGYFVLTLFSALNKSVQERLHFPAGEVMFFDGMVGMWCMVAASLWQGNVKGLKMGHWLQAPLMLINTVAAFLLFSAYPYLPLVNAYLIGYTGPLMITAMGALFLKERITWRQGAAILAGFAGVAFALGPKELALNTAVLEMFGGTVLFSVAQVMVRKLSNTESIWSFPFYFYIGMFCLSGLLFHESFVMPQGAGQWGMALSLGVFDALSLGMMYLGLKYAETSTVAPFQYSSLLWVTLLDIFLWSKYPAARTWLGAGVVVRAGIYLVMHTRRLQRETLAPALPMPPPEDETEG